MAALRAGVLARHLTGKLPEVQAVCHCAGTGISTLQTLLARIALLSTNADLKASADLLYLRTILMHPRGFHVPTEELAAILKANAVVPEQHGLRTFIKNTNILDELPLQQRIGVAWGLTDDLAANQTKISSFLRSEERALLQWPLAILLCRSDPTGQWAADLASKFCFAKKNKEGVRPQEAAGQVAVVALCGCFQTTRFINRPVATIQQRPRQKSVAKQDDNDLIPDKGAKRVKKRNRDAVSPSTRTSSDEPAGRKRVKRVAQPVAGGATTAGDEPVTGDLATVAWYSMYGPGPDEWSRVPAPLIQTPLLGRAPGLLAAGASLDLLPLDPLRGKAEPIESPLPTSPFQDVRDDDDNEGDDDSLFGGVRYNADPRDNPGDSEDPTGQHAFVPDNTPLGRLDVDPDLRLSDFSDPESDMDWGESN